mgnify:FL=1
MNWINTYTEKYFDVMDPDPDLIDIRDVAHSLSLQCRGNGHVKSFFSVAQHCVNCCREAAARGCSRRVTLACLLHDASEAYMCDIPRPVKKLLPQYIEHENKLLDIIYTKYLGSKLTDEEQKQVKQIDDDMLYYDLTVLLNMDIDQEEPDTHIHIDFEPVPFEKVENEYLSLFYGLIRAL